MSSCRAAETLLALTLGLRWCSCTPAHWWRSRGGDLLLRIGVAVGVVVDKRQKSCQPRLAKVAVLVGLEVVVDFAFLPHFTPMLAGAFIGGPQVMALPSGSMYARDVGCSASHGAGCSPISLRAACRSRCRRAGPCVDSSGSLWTQSD